MALSLQLIDKFIIMDSLEERVMKVSDKLMEYLGLEIIKVNLVKGTPNILKLIIDRKDEAKVSLADCQLVSKHISTLLDVENIMPLSYCLEVSSAGIERPLVRLADYIRFLNRVIKVELNWLFEGQVRYQGKIVRIENNNISLELQDRCLLIPFGAIKRANLVMTQELFKKLLNKY